MSEILELNQVKKSFEIGTINERQVLKGIDLSIEEGDFVTVIGGNGAGKSTLLNSIAGSFPIDSGQILIDGVDVTDEKTSQRAKYIGRVFQDPRMGSATRLSIEQNLSIAYSRGKKRGLKKGVNEQDRMMFKEQLTLLDLGLEDRLKMEVGLLSGGQRQALTLLMATIVSPKLLLLDEHTAALDPKTSQLVLELTDKMITEKKLTSFMITHNMNDAIKYGNRLIMLNNGQIVVDIKGEEKQGLTVTDLLDLFQKNSGMSMMEDNMVLI